MGPPDGFTTAGPLTHPVVEWVLGVLPRTATRCGTTYTTHGDSPGPSHFLVSPVSFVPISRTPSLKPLFVPLPPSLFSHPTVRRQKPTYPTSGASLRGDSPTSTYGLPDTDGSACKRKINTVSGKYLIVTGTHKALDFPLPFYKCFRQGVQSGSTSTLDSLNRTLVCKTPERTGNRL